MIVATLLTISATITAVLAYPAEKYDYYSGYETAFTFPCGDSVPNVCIQPVFIIIASLY